MWLTCCCPKRPPTLYLRITPKEEKRNSAPGDCSPAEPCLVDHLVSLPSSELCFLFHRGSRRRDKDARPPMPASPKDRVAPGPALDTSSANVEPWWRIATARVFSCAGTPPGPGWHGRWTKKMKPMEGTTTTPLPPQCWFESSLLLLCLNRSHRAGPRQPSAEAWMESAPERGWCKEEERRRGNKEDADEEAIWEVGCEAPDGED